MAMTDAWPDGGVELVGGPMDGDQVAIPYGVGEFRIAMTEYVDIGVLGTNVKIFTGTYQRERRAPWIARWQGWQ